MRGRRAAVAVANVAFWAAAHTATGWWAHRLAPERLGRDGPVLRLRGPERGGAAYERIGIRRWKDRLPEAGALFAGGVSKRHLPARGRAGLEAFARETRRAERAHWLALACGPLAALWNPPVGTAAMVAYGVVANAPFIAVQRYNRARVLALLERSSTSRRARAPAGPRTSGSSMP